MRRALKAVVCAVLGHLVFNDPIGRPFSTRYAICQRCGKRGAV